MFALDMKDMSNIIFFATFCTNLCLFRCVSISINSKFTDLQTYRQTDLQTLSRVYSYNPM